MYQFCSQNDTQHSACIPLARNNYRATISARNLGTCSLAHGLEEEEINFGQELAVSDTIKEFFICILFLSREIVLHECGYCFPFFSLHLHWLYFYLFYQLFTSLIPWFLLEVLSVFTVESHVFSNPAFRYIKVNADSVILMNWPFHCYRITLLLLIISFALKPFSATHMITPAFFQLALVWYFFSYPFTLNLFVTFF